MSLFDELFMLQRIDQLIRMQATGTPAQLASRLQVSERKLYRLLEQLKDQGFPIAYDKQKDSYYYEIAVKIEFSVVVGQEKLVFIRGGEKKMDIFGVLPDYGSRNHLLCNASPSHGAQ